MIQVLKTPKEFQQLRSKNDWTSVGFVPTMGALHEGHFELLKKARSENKIVVLSIYVNQTQFNDPADFDKYPITFEKDLALATSAGVDYIFAPQFSDMYPDKYTFKVIETEFSNMLCGAHRPGHFDGVLSVVMKLFNIVAPQKAYFGEKDFQQLSLIKKMTEAFFMDVSVIPVPTVRAVDGLALSSRNARLSIEQRKIAPEIYKIISSNISAAEATLALSQNFKVDYVFDFEGRRYVAVYLGDVRLIDNVSI